MTEQYYKATLKDGWSAASYEPRIQYKVGMVIHPKPDNSDASCGAGIHLAKTIQQAKRYVPTYQEIYLAVPGVILSEDDTKVRCRYCKIIRQLDAREIEEIEAVEIAPIKAEEKRRREIEAIVGKALTTPVMCEDWVRNHCHITQVEWEKQTLEVSTPRHTFSMKPTLKRKEIKTVLEACLA